MKNVTRVVLTLAAVAIAAAGCSRGDAAESARGAGLAAAALTVAAPAAPQAMHPGEVALRLRIATEGNEARYRVREQLVGVDFPNDAVGRTSAVTGIIELDENGDVIAASSRIVVDVTGLRSDRDRRDNYLQRRVLDTEQHPTVVLIPTALRGLSLPLPTTGTKRLDLHGDLTVRGVTRPTRWRVDARFGEATIEGTASTAFTFDDLAITKPRVRSVLSVADTIKLEYEFRLVPEPVGRY